MHLSGKTGGVARAVVKGLPTLMAGSRPLAAPVFCLYYDQALRESVVKMLYANGIRAFAVRSHIGVGSSGQTDESLERAATRLRAVARFAPDAKLIADCLFFPSAEWMRTHPHEGFFTADNQILVMGNEALPFPREYVKVPGPAMADARGRRIAGADPRLLYGRRRVSPFSTLFAAEASKSAARLVRALQKSGVAGQLWGIFLECYNCGEWNLGMYSPDHGLAAIRGFRAFLRGKYGSNRVLQAAWDDPLAMLKTALPPRNFGGMKGDGVRLMSARCLDYREAESRNLADQFLSIARTIKRRHPFLAAGGFYPGASAPQSDCRRLYADPAVDFIATPLAYENRGPGGGVNSQSPFCDALRPLGKVWFDELDTRTHLANKVTQANWGRAETSAQSAELLWRDAGQMLVRGHHGWWLDFGGEVKHADDGEVKHADDTVGAEPFSWHLHPELLEFHRQFAGIWSDLERLDRHPRGETKVFISSSAACSHDVSGLAGSQRHTEWTLAGVPIEYDMLENLVEGISRPGKLNIIPHAQVLDGKTLKRLAQLCADSRAWFVWMNTPAMCSPGRLPDESRAELIPGLPVQVIPLKTPMAIEGKITHQGAAFLRLRRDAAIGQSFRILKSGFVQRMDLGKPMPPVVRQDRHAILCGDGTLPLARFAGATSYVAVALRKAKSGVTHVGYNLPVMNSFFLRALARKAGCHVFTDTDDIVYASRGLLLLHAAFSGVHTLHLPHSGAIFDLRAQRRVAVRNKTLRIHLPRGTTRLYRI